MHHDFKKGGKTEFQSLTEYISIAGSQENIATPTFDLITKAFVERTKKNIFHNS
jgi:ketopantoate reductase